MTSIRLTDDEAWAELAQAHTGIHTTMRRDGWPLSLPTWFVVVDRRIYLRTPSRSKKVGRVRRDQRGCFLVERGERWVDLCAVVVPVIATEVDPADIDPRVDDAFEVKYEGFRVPMRTVPDATKKAYAGMTTLRLEPAGPPITWDNARIRVGTAG